MGGKIGKALPLLVFGALCVVAGLLLFLLPETVGRELPGTIQDGINFGKLAVLSYVRHCLNNNLSNFYFLLLTLHFTFGTSHLHLIPTCSNFSLPNYHTSRRFRDKYNYLTGSCFLFITGL